jgi:hypothetical protein
MTAFMSATEALGLRERTLLEQGADPLRIEILQRARRFKRSWIEMAEALLKVKASGVFESWGYADLYAYCDEELLIKRRTVDKLTGSLSTIQQHAPQVLSDDRDTPIPNYDAVEYFKKVIEAPESSPHDPEMMEELRTAVFDEGTPANLLRKQFNPIFFAKTNEDVRLDALLKVKNTAERLERLLSDVDGITEGSVTKVSTALEGLNAELDKLIPPARARAEVTRAA